jgi:hypothetical protein
VDSVGSTIASVFRDNGWSVTGRDELPEGGRSFDFVFESQAAIVFCVEIAAEELEERAKRLTAEVAALTQRRSIGVKAWEAYLLFICAGDLIPHERAVQSVQHDLAYCRKIIIPKGVIETASDPYSAARRFVTFLLPLDPTDRVPFTDVRVALAQGLEADGIDPTLATELVGNFDESSCHCGERMKAFNIEHQGTLG